MTYISEALIKIMLLLAIVLLEVDILFIVVVYIYLYRHQAMGLLVQMKYGQLVIHTKINNQGGKI